MSKPTGPVTTASSQASSQQQFIEEGSCCGRSVQWIRQNPLLFVFNLLLIAGIAATASVDLSLEIKLYACLSGAAVLLLIDGVYYPRSRTVEGPASVDPIPEVGVVPQQTILSQDFMAFLKAAGYGGEDVVDVVSCVEMHKLTGDQLKPFYRVDFVDQASSYGEYIYFPKFKISVGFAPQRNSIEIIKMVESTPLLVGRIDRYEMNAQDPSWTAIQFKLLVQGKPNELMSSDDNR